MQPNPSCVKEYVLPRGGDLGRIIGGIAPPSNI